MDWSAIGERPNSTSVRQQLTERIRDAIIEMRLRPGDRLIERDIVEWSGVSRATVREAIRELETMRLVEMAPRRGAVVASLSPQEATELYEIRASLEGIVGRQCTVRATDEQVAEVRARFEGMVEAVRGGSVADILREKGNIYEALFDGAGNDTVREILSGLQARISVLRAISMTQPGRETDMVKEVEAIVEAIEARDSAAAERACAAHVTAAGKVAIAALLDADQVPQTNLHESRASGL